MVQRASQFTGEMIIIADVNSLDGVLPSFYYDLFFSQEIPSSILVFLIRHKRRIRGEHWGFRCNECYSHVPKDLPLHQSDNRHLFRVNSEEEADRLFKEFAKKNESRLVFLSHRTLDSALRSSAEVFETSLPKFSNLSFGNFLTSLGISHEIPPRVIPSKKTISLVSSSSSHQPKEAQVSSEASDVQLVVRRVTEWLHRNKFQTESLPKTSKKFIRAISPLCHMRGSFPAVPVLQLFVDYHILTTCLLCGCLTIDPESKVPSSCPPKLGEHVERARQILQGMKDFPSTPEKLLEHLQSIPVVYSTSPTDVWESVSQLGLVESDEDTDSLEYHWDALTNVILEDSRQKAEEEDSTAVIASVRQLLGDTREILSPQQLRWSQWFNEARRHKPDALAPCADFEDLQISEELLRGIFSYGFEKPTQVQQEVLPHLVKGESVFFQGSCSSGKSSAAAIGLLSKIVVKDKHPQGIVICPTRELAEQLASLFGCLSELLGLNIVTSVGGTMVSANVRNIRDSHIIVGTPGRLVHMIERKSFQTDKIRVIMMDEVDNLVDHHTDILATLFQVMPKQTQDIMCCSIISPQTISVVKKQFSSAKWILTARPEELLHSRINVYTVDHEKEEWKLHTLVDLLDRMEYTQMIIYCNTKRKVDWLSSELRKKNFVLSSWVSILLLI